METKTFIAPTISCAHCTRTIEAELGGLAGVTAVKADAESKEVMVQWGPPATWEKIESILKEVGYQPAP